MVPRHGLRRKHSHPPSCSNRDRSPVDSLFMQTEKPSQPQPSDGAFEYIDGINMEVAVELLGQEIAKLSTAIEDEENADHRPSRLRALNQKRTALRRRQQGLRSENVVAVQAVFDQYGRGQK